MMCNCSDFDGWKDSDRGGAPGCSYVKSRPALHGSSIDHVNFKDKYCSVHKPVGAVKYEPIVCVIM